MKRRIALGGALIHISARGGISCRAGSPGTHPPETLLNRSPPESSRSSLPHVERAVLIPRLSTQAQLLHQLCLIQKPSPPPRVAEINDHGAPGAQLFCETLHFRAK